MSDLIADLPKGPLTPFRETATFDWKALKVHLEGEESIKFKNEVYAVLSRDPIFARDFSRPSTDEYREINHKRWKAVLEHQFIDDFFAELERTQDLLEILETYDQGLSGRYALHANVFFSAILTIGTERHAEILEKTRNNEIVGCFCLTEVSHGSNTAEIGTLATFDKGEFVFTTPHDGAIKCWAGNLAQSATHAVVFARLIVGGKDHGPHAFALQVRDPNNYRSLPGITIGDMGTKPGVWDGVENGWMSFSNHRAPLWTLLNKGCDVTESGEYKSAYSSSRERQSVSLGSLSAGRIGANACRLAATIAIRYSCARHQFGEKPGSDNERAVITYPLQRHRLFPILAQAYVIRLYQSKLMNHFREYMMRMVGGEKSPELAELSKEVHGLSSCTKPLATWMGVAALGEARTCCGGHGFLQSSRLNNLRDDFDPSQTFEGENNVLLQQTSNWLVAKKAAGGDLKSPMGTTDFLVDGGALVDGPVVRRVLGAYTWLVHHLIAKTEMRHKELKAQGKSSFDVKNESQIYTAHTLSIAYGERVMLSWAQAFVDDAPIAFKSVLQRLVNIFALDRIEKHLSTLYIGGFCSGGSFGEWVRNTLIDEETLLAPDAISLVDVIAPPDFVLNSALGSSDGRAYEHLMAEFRRHTDKRTPFWGDLATFLHHKQQSKL
ncbi:unnamed protein product, partial [Mesorhabditis belari]|uniref:Acyl-coenzyme A oxidase n=1 Tax=Mesorhabditis belari TaxID=2138241 RepID=A0AAF3FQQ6_9BILA